MYGGGDYGDGGAGAGGGFRPRHDATHTEGKLFLGGLSHDTTKESLTAYCESWGPITDVAVMDTRGFGFVTFADPKNAQRFLEQRSHTIDGRVVEAKAAVPKSAGGSSQLTKKMFVGGCGELTDDEFRNYFAQFGEIEDCVVVRKDGISRGFGFVTYMDEMCVEKCLVQQHILNGKKVELKRAVPKDQYNAGRGYGSGGRGGVGGGRGGGYGMGGGRGYGGGGGGGYGMGGGDYGGAGRGYGGMGGRGGYGGASGGGYAMGGRGYGGAAAAGGYGMGGGRGGYGAADYASAGMGMGGEAASSYGMGGMGAAGYSGAGMGGGGYGMGGGSYAGGMGGGYGRTQPGRGGAAMNRFAPY